MRDGGVGGDHQIETGYDGGAVGEIPHPAAKISQLHAGGREGRLFRTLAYLERMEADSLHPGERSEELKGEGAPAVILVAFSPGPDQPDSESLSRHPGAPELDQTGFRTQIGDLGRYGGKPGAHQKRQAHERRVAVEFGQRFSTHQHPGHPGDRGEDRRYRLGLALHQHGPAHAGQKRRIAHELDGVTKALLGMEQDDPPPQVPAVPKRPRKILQGDRVRLPEAPLVPLPPCFELSQLQLRQGHVPVGIRVIWVAGDHLPVTGNRPVQLPERTAGGAQVVQGMQVIRVTAEGPLVAFHRLVQPVLSLQGDAEGI